MIQVAVYGKGGIGKSTLSANLSAALALQGSRVLQIGCDPKQDSTRLLLGGSHPPTVLDYLRRTKPSSRHLDDVMVTGFAGVACVEAGGPEPGVGCAGRGILSAIELLEQLGAKDLGFDLTLYDVLGDVVCGGFAVPLRDAYADLVFIVTSGEFMALYAANNILRGVRNFEGRGPRVGGILLNRRGVEDETDRVARFAEAVRLPVLLDLPRDTHFMQAEQQGRTLLQSFPDLELCEAFMDLARRVQGGCPAHPALPLDPDRLEAHILGRSTLPVPSPAIQAHSQETPSAPPQRALPQSTVPRRYWSKSMRRQEALHGCAYNAAVHTALQVQDGTIVVHGPRSCAFISHSGISGSARRTWRRTGQFQASSLTPAILCTGMDEQVSIFGGADLLAKQLLLAIESRPEILFVATTCAAGIIGDDVARILTYHRKALGAIPVISLKADGNLTGDYMQGILDASFAIGKRLIDPDVAPEPGLVNLVGEKNLATNTESNFQVVKHLVESLGLEVNCRFIRSTKVAELRGFMKAGLNLLANEDAMGRAMKNFLRDHFEARFLEYPFPVGFEATDRWVRALGEATGRRIAAEALIHRERATYEAERTRLRPALQGKRLMLVTSNHHIDWLVDTALDLDMEIVRVGILASVWDDHFQSRYEGRIPLSLAYTREARDRDMAVLAPDLTLTNAAWPGQPPDCRIEFIPYCPDCGFHAGLEVADRWRRAMQLPPGEGWRDDL